MLAPEQPSPAPLEFQAAAEFLSDRRLRRTQLGALPGDAHLEAQLVGRLAGSVKKSLPPPVTPALPCAVPAGPHPKGVITDEEFAESIAVVVDMREGRLERKLPDGAPMENIFTNK
jgi:hypothetical protein